MKKILAFIMAMLMILTCFSALSMGVLAAEGDEVVDDGAGDVNPDEGEGEGEDTPAAPDLSVKYEINFRKYSEDVSAAFAANSNKVTITKEAKSGYATIEATEGDDPYVVFAGGVDITEDFPITNMSYIVFKYRTNTSNATADFYMNGIKADGPAAGWGTAPAFANFIGDGQWHVAKLDITGWAAVEGVTRLQDMRLDIVPAGACVFDLAYVKFFASVEGADAQMAAEQVSKTVQGEMNEGDARIVEAADGVYYSAIDLVALFAKADAEGVYVDADNNEYTLRGNYVINADGTDTGLSLIKDVDGNAYAYAHLFQLAYIDPTSAAVEIEGVKYVYGSKAEATPMKAPVLPDVTPGAKPAEGKYTVSPFHNSCDTIRQSGNNTPIDGMAGKHMQDVMKGYFYDVDKTMTSVGLRGWIGLNTSAVVKLGYAINDGDPVWQDSFFESTEQGVKDAGGEFAQRYTIDIPTADLEDGIYFISILVMVEGDETIYSANTTTAGSDLGAWGADIWYVKGGSWTIGSYNVGDDAYTFGEDDALLVNGEAAPDDTKLVITEDAATVYTTLVTLESLGDAATGKYTYNTTLNYVATPAVPYDPATLTPDVLFQGADMATTGTNMISEYNYENGFVTYTVDGGDPNAGNWFVGQVLPRYMVVKYRTTDADGDGFFVACGDILNNSSNIATPWVTDGEWHSEIIDLTRSAHYVEGQPIKYFRADMLHGGALDVAYIAFFNDKLAAETYIEEKLWTAPVYHSATFVDENGDTVKVVMFEEGATKLIGAPAVPKKDGYKGAWAEYTLGTEDITIAPVYTLKEVATDAPEADTDAPEAGTDAPEAGTDAPEAGTDAPEAGTNAPEAGTNAPEAATDEAGTTAEAGTEAGTKAEAGTTAGTTAGTDAAAEEGCSSVVGFGAIAVIMTAAAAAVALKKKED